MRQKLALFAAATVVFAPGWGAGEGVTGPRSTFELAGRILAPTFEEASAAPQGESTRAYKAVDHVKKRSISSKAPAWGSSASSLPRLEQLCAVAVAALLLAVIGHFPASRSPRAPPHLLTA